MFLYVNGLYVPKGAGVQLSGPDTGYHDLTPVVLERLARQASGVSTVALSGGVFQNLLPLEAAVASLEARGFRVLCHRRVPPNDGGICLGQAAVAGARDRARDRGGPRVAS